MNNQRNHDEQRVTIKRFNDPSVPGTGIEIQGFKDRPRTWSLNFFTTLKDNRPGRFLRGDVTVENAKATADMAGMRYARLIDEALLFKQDAVQKDSDDYIERKQAREIRDMERGQGKQQEAKPSPLGAGLTPEQRQAKKQRHEANQAAKRAADQARTSQTKGKGK